MTDTTKPMHTPMVSPISFDTGYLNAADSEVLGRIYMSERAALIVRAVNSFEAMKEALEFYANPKIYEPHPHGPAFEKRDLSFCAIAALKRAKGE